MKRMLFAELDIETINKKAAIEWIKNVPKNYWFWNSYRHCEMLCLMTKNGGWKKSDSINQNSQPDFLWTSITPDLIKSYFERVIFTWTKRRSRIIIIKTRPYKENKIHIDCSPSMFYTTQNKLRIVLQGSTDSLYFETKQGRVHAPQTEKPFLIDGAWPHGMINASCLPKYTICLGSPWTQSNNYPGLKPLVYKHTIQSLPVNYEKYFDKKYKRTS